MLSARIDGTTEIGGVQINEILDNNHSFVLARINPDFSTDYAKVLHIENLLDILEANSSLNSEVDTYISSRSEYFWIQDLPDERLLVTENATITVYRRSNYYYDYNMSLGIGIDPRLYPGYYQDV